MTLCVTVIPLTAANAVAVTSLVCEPNIGVASVALIPGSPGAPGSPGLPGSPGAPGPAGADINGYDPGDLTLIFENGLI